MRKLGLLGIVLGASLAASSTAQAQAHANAFKSNNNSFTIQLNNTPGYKLPAAKVLQRRKTWIPGHYETRYEQVYHPGHYEKVWVDANYLDFNLGSGRSIRIGVNLGHFKRVWRDAYYTTEARQTWVCGQWVECFE